MKTIDLNGTQGGWRDKIVLNCPNWVGSPTRQNHHVCMHGNHNDPNMWVTDATESASRHWWLRLSRLTSSRLSSATLRVPSHANHITKSGIWISVRTDKGRWRLPTRESISSASWLAWMVLEKPRNFIESAVSQATPSRLMGATFSGGTAESIRGVSDAFNLCSCVSAFCWIASHQCLEVLYTFRRCSQSPLHRCDRDGMWCWTQLRG